jgi:hypothetical protein
MQMKAPAYSDSLGLSLIKCEVPGTCILDGGTTGEELVVLTNLLDTSLLEAFLSVSGLPPPPEGYVVDSTIKISPWNKHASHCFQHALGQ